MYHGIIKQHDEDIMSYANKEKGTLFLYIYIYTNNCTCYGVLYVLKLLHRLSYYTYYLITLFLFSLSSRYLI